MQLVLHSVSLVHIILLAQVTLGIALLYDQPRARGLVYLLALVGILTLFNLLEENQITRDIHLVTPVFSLLCGPLFYWFVYRFLFGEAELTSRRLLHLLPAFLALPVTTWPQGILFVGTISQLLYFAASISLLKRYHHATEERTACSDLYRLDWLKRLLVAVAIIVMVDLIRLNLQPVLNYTLAYWWYFSMQLLFAFLYATLIFFAVRRPELFEEVSENDVEAQKRTKTTYSEKEHVQAQQIFTQLDEQIQQHNWYQQPRLTLRKLAEHTGMQEKDLSWAINVGGQKSFNDYINHLRLQAFSRQLQATPKHQQNLLAIALDCGFNSKSSFNAVFKQQLGVTPSEYARTLSQQVQNPDSGR
ncbi:helix-turn-helix transcriptional regulator [Lacimicrobium sp. SS2-24]|uniref:helix-turn-helix transcriptional regulator n=1 Tax=Lacimicrobium sp. SS2-24 TaxID=2005569 RepID=UPI000B4AB198|nr:helix-turn-helix transcriptional regulator [Lacimicrobium sp. SS2-24]